MWSTFVNKIPTLGYNDHGQEQNGYCDSLYYCLCDLRHIDGRHIRLEGILEVAGQSRERVLLFHQTQIRSATQVCYLAGVF